MTDDQWAHLQVGDILITNEKASSYQWTRAGIEVEVIEIVPNVAVRPTALSWAEAITSGEGYSPTLLKIVEERNMYEIAGLRATNYGTIYDLTGKKNQIEYFLKVRSRIGTIE